MKKRSFVILLLAVLMLCSLAGCGTAQEPEPHPQEGPSTTTTPIQPQGEAIPLSLTVGEETPAEGLFYEDTSVAECNYTLVLTANADLTNVRLLSLNPDSSTVDETLYTMPTLAAGQCWYIRTYVNDATANRGVACTDKQGKFHYFAFTYSGKDGSVSLTQIEKLNASAPIPVEILTADELIAVQDYLNKMENNGFVGTRYDAPEEVSLEWVLYDGAGVGEWVSDWDQAEKQALLTANGWEEIYVPVMKYPAAAVEQLVQEKLGISMEQLEKPLELSYLEEYDAYYHMHSDTNYLPVTVVEGSRSADGVYYVQYRDAFDPHSLYKVTLRKTEHGYQFISNQLI